MVQLAEHTQQELCLKQVEGENPHLMVSSDLLICHETQTPAIIYMNTHIQTNKHVDTHTHTMI